MTETIYMGIIVGYGEVPQRIMKNSRILALDPSGTGTTGICLMENNQATFKEFESPN
jgi:hypothetical protein